MSDPCVKDVGVYDVWTTFHIHSGLDGRPLRGFYAVGDRIPGAHRDLRATRMETNLQRANEMPKGFSVHGLAWHISDAVPDVFQQAGAEDYRVTEDDVSAILRSAELEIRFDAILIVCHPTETVRTEGGWNGFFMCDCVDGLLKGRKFGGVTAELRWPDGVPQVGGTVDFCVRILGIVTRSET